jgi:hypothetical protein
MALQAPNNDLTCPICLEWFREAVETDCGHAFCCECLLRVVNRDDEACVVPLLCLAQSQYP